MYALTHTHTHTHTIWKLAERDHGPISKRKRRKTDGMRGREKERREGVTGY